MAPPILRPASATAGTASKSLSGPSESSHADRDAGPIPVHLDRRLIEGPVARTLIVFALPLLGTNTLHSVSGTMNAIWVSHALGPNALTAVVNSNVLLFLLLGMVIGIGMAANIVVAQAYGAGNLREVKRVTGSAVAFVLMTGVSLSVLGAVFTPAIIDLLRIPPAAAELTSLFLRAMCLSLPSVFLLILASMLMRGCGDANTPFRFTVLWIGLQLILSPVLLLGAFGAPKLGISGVAIGNLLASTIALILLVRAIYRRDLPIALRGEDLRFLRPDPAVMALLWRRGLPMALESVLVQGAYVAMLSLVNDYGANAAAAYGAVSQLWAYVQLPVMAISASVASMASQNIGAGRWDRIGEIALKSCLVGCAVTSAIVGLIYALGDLPLKLFLPQGGETLDIAVQATLITLWSWIPLAITFGIFGVVRANGAMLPPTLILAGTLWLARIPFAHAFQPMLGIEAIWWSFPVGTVGCALVSYAYYRYGGWRSNALLVPGGSA